MLRLSKKVEYSLMALLHMDGQDSAMLTSSREVAETYHIPVELLGKVLQALARAEVVESVHGAHGGYRLVRALETLTLGDVLEAVDGPLHLVRCHENTDSCDQYEECNIREPILRVQQQLVDYLAAFRLADFRRERPRETKAKGGL